MSKELACIVCPKSCVLNVVETAGDIYVSGNQCKRGFVFAEQELTDPQRILTTTIKLTNGELMPVRSTKPLSKSEYGVLVEKLRLIVGMSC